MKRLFVLFFLLLLAVSSSGQVFYNVDSLLNVLKTHDLSSDERFKLYKTILESTGDSKIITECINTGLPLAQKEKNKLMESVFNEYTGRIFAGKAMYDSAMFYFDKALHLSIEAKDKNQESSVYTALAVINGFQGKYKELIEYQLKGLKIMESMNEKQGIQAALGNIGNAYGALNDNEHALQYQEKALALAEELNLPNAISSSHYALGSTYFNMKKFEEAEKHLLKAYEFGKQVHAGYVIQSYILTGLSELYNEGIKDLDKAEKYGKEGLAIAQKLHNPSLLANAYKGMSSIYRIRGLYEECDSAATKAWELDSVNMDLGIIITANLTYANIELGNKERALRFFNEYFALVNKYNEKSLHESLTSQEVKYETEKKDIQIASLVKEKQLYTWIGIAGILLVLSLVMILFQIIRNTKREKQLIAARSVMDGEMKERVRLARDLHDRLSGNLSAVKIELNNAEALINIGDKLDSCIEEVRRVAHNLMPVSLRHGIKMALEDFAVQFSNVHFYFFGEDKRIEERLEFVIYCCANELVNNSLRHSGARVINIQLVQDHDHVTLTVQDDGKGYDEKTVTKGLGLKNIYDRVASCGGKVDIVSSPDKGTETTIELKIRKTKTPVL